MTLDEVKRLVARGEGPRIEFKLRVPSGERLAKEVIALANSGGGKILLGVDDDGTIVGVKDSEEEEFSLRNALEGYCRPRIRWASTRIPVTRKRDIILVSIPNSKSKPHHLVAKPGGYTGPVYVRVEDRSIEASPESIALMRAEHSKEGVQFEFGDRELLLMKYLEMYGRVTVEGYAQISGTSQTEAGEVLVNLTLAGVIERHLEKSGEYFTLHYAEES